MTLEPGSFIDKELREYETDILYSVQLNKFNKKRIYTYFLVEHTSRQDKWLSFRLIKYMCRIVDQLKKQKPRLEGLPLIIPLICYNGKRAYRPSTYVFDLFNELKPIAEKVFTSPFKLVDFNLIADEQIRKHRWSGLMEFCLKHAKRGDLLLSTVKAAWHPIVVKLLERREEDIDEYALSLINYMLEVSAEDGEEFLEEFLQLTRINPEVERKMLTMKQQLEAKARWQGKQEGIEQGIEQGREQGIEQGIERGKLVIIKNLYNKFRDINQVAALSGIESKEVKRLLAKN